MNLKLLIQVLNNIPEEIPYEPRRSSLDIFVEQSTKPASFSFMTVPKSSAPFYEILREMVDAHYKKHSDCFNKVGVNKHDFSRMVTGKGYPSRESVIKIAVAMELPIDEANVFLKKAGYAFKDSEPDITIECAIRQGIYSPTVIDCMLDEKGIDGFFRMYEE